MSALRVTACTVFASFCVAATMAACQRAPEEAADTEASVAGDTVTLHQGTEGIVTAVADAVGGRVLQLPGRLVWNEEATVRVFSPFAGRVLRIAAQPGDSVAAGQVLAEFSSSDYGAAQADARKATALFTLARKARDRNHDLLEHGVVAAKDAEQAESDFANAEAENARAQARLKLAGDNGGAVDQRYVLRSPIAGVVVDRALNPGQEVLPDQSGAPLFVVTDPETLWVRLDAQEAELRGLHKGEEFVLRCGEYPDEHFPGALTQIADFVDPVTRSVSLRGRVANPGRRLKAEMYVSAGLSMPGAAPVAVPASAVFLVGNQRHVFIAKSPTQFERRDIVTDEESQGLVPVESGLAAGERVVTEGALYLQQLLAAAER